MIPDHLISLQTLSFGLKEISFKRSKISLYQTSCEDNTKSPRTSENDGRYWIFYPPDQALLEKMGCLVGRNSRNLECRSIIVLVY